MMPVLQVGPFALPLPVLTVLIGLWLGLTLTERFAARNDLKADLVINTAMLGLISGVIASRFGYVLRHLSAFIASPMDVFSRNLGLFDPIIGIAVGVISSAIYAQRKDLRWLPTLDALTPALAVFAIALHLSHLASGEAYGTPSNLAWSIELWGIRRHPSQIYEAAAALAILIYLWPGRKNVTSLLPGEYFIRFMTLSAASLLFLEGFRGDSALLPGGLRIPQITAWLVLATSLVALGRRRQKINIR